MRYVITYLDANGKPIQIWTDVFGAAQDVSLSLAEYSRSTIRIADTHTGKVAWLENTDYKLVF